MTLYELTLEQRVLEELLFANGGELTPEIEEAMQMNGSDFSEKLDAYTKMIAEYDALIAATDVEMKKLAEKKQKAQNAKKRVREYILYCLKSANKTKFESRSGVMFSRGVSKSVEVDEETLFTKYDLEARIRQMNLPPYLQLVPKVVKSNIDKDNLPEGCRVVETDKVTIR